MLRKFSIAAVIMASFAGFSVADDESPLEQLMEKIQAKTNALNKATRNAAEYKKAAGSITKDLEEVLKLSKESREFKEPAQKEKKPQAEWEKLSDDMIHATEDLEKLVKDSKTTQTQAKESFVAFRKTCSACHNVFKKED